MHVFVFIYKNKYTQYTLIYYVNKNLFWMRLIAINHLTALVLLLKRAILFLFTFDILSIYFNIVFMTIFTLGIKQVYCTFNSLRIWYNTFKSHTLVSGSILTSN